MPLSVIQVSELLGVSKGMVYQLAAPHGPIPCTRIGRRIIFDIEDVQAFKESSKVVQAPELLPRLRPRASSMKLVLLDRGSDLREAFRKLGIKIPDPK